MNFALYIAKRYLFTKSSNNAINIMTIIAASGVVVAAAALFIVLSGFAGLKDFSLEFSSFVDPDLKITPAQGKSFLLTEKDSTALRNIDGIASYSNIIEERIIIEFDNKNVLASLKGVDDQYLNVTNIDSMIIQGQWFQKGSGQLVSGWGIAHNLSFGVLDYGKTLNVYVPKPGVGQISSIKGAFNSLTMVNIGVFDVNEDLNASYVYTDIANARYLMDYAPNQLSSIEIKLHPNADEKSVRNAILEQFETDVIVKNRAQLNDSLYKMLNTENLVVYLIFTLVIIIALFNVIGALIMMILDKKGSLHTLYNIGATTKDIRRVFFLQGSLMTILGGFVGVLIGFILVVLQQQFALVMITPSLPYPVNIKVMNIVLVLVTITVLGLIASKIASGRITEKLIRS
ncbi:lipoprotein-releasing system permease protein [Gelidibacter sediminis]|uniref:Lipoprotein-releasing system permease protein n=1 Tax=Gelidibacter sediminis TaxID=1608710 RepID=A0A4R7Q975_9FLAO|nr:ABC transporter permease [Gelidibacter sediminis]TDU43499.1 lipoprotein-releasing system permease protein [Gelidibacter sediminis]